jgi:tetratricopeptide (TPR) repeat protein
MWWYPEKAIEILDRVLDKKPNNWLALYTKGMTFVSMWDHKEALKYFDEALKIKKEDYILACKWDSLSNLWRNEEAIKCFDKALALNPKNSLTYSSKWYSLMGLKKYKEALKCLNTALELNPNDYWAQQCILIIHQKYL